VTFKKGDIIFRQGDDAQTMYIIAEGTVKILITDKKDIILTAG
jgi:CRP-like cAMP-binding protein